MRIIVSACTGANNDSVKHVVLKDTLSNTANILCVKDAVGVYNGIKESCVVAQLEDISEERLLNILDALLYLFDQESILVEAAKIGGTFLYFADGRRVHSKGLTASNRPLSVDHVQIGEWCYAYQF